MSEISIIVPFYNSREALPHCLNSIINQKFKDYEIVLIDDGSSDDSIKVIKDFFKEKNFNNYKILSQKNSGPGIARNLGILNSSSNFIAFIDSDDVWDSTHLDLLYQNIKKTNADLVFTTKTINTTKCKKITLNKLLFRCYIQSSTLIAKKDILLKYNFRNGKRYSEDYDLWLRLAAENFYLLFLPIIDVRNYENKNSFGEKGLSKNLREMEKNELENYQYLYKNKKINVIQYISASLFSLLKYVKRIFTK